MKVLNKIDLYVSCCANKKLLKKCDDLEQSQDDSLFQYMINYGELSKEELQVFYEETRSTKKILESKSQYSLIAITIATSLIVGLSGTILKMSLENNIIVAIIYVLGCLSIACLIIAGVLSLNCIGEYNREYRVFPRDLRSKDIKRITALRIEQNNQYNFIRNNLMNTSYRYIKKGLIFLGILFLVIVGSKILSAKSNNIMDSLITQVEKQKEIIEKNRDEITELEKLILEVKKDIENKDLELIELEKRIDINDKEYIERSNKLEEKLNKMNYKMDKIINIFSDENKKNK